MKTYADSKSHHEEFQVGDLVFLKLRPYSKESLARQTNEKLATRYYGPFPVLQRIDQVAYLATASIFYYHPFSFSCFSASESMRSHQLPSHYPQLTRDLVLHVEPETLLDVHPKQKGQSGELEVLLKCNSVPL